jgi:hypothetical protein
MLLFRLTQSLRRESDSGISNEKAIVVFSTDTSSFAKEVKRAQVSGNLDAPEGGFDAIMQVLLFILLFLVSCKN